MKIERLNVLDMAAALDTDHMAVTLSIADRHGIVMIGFRNTRGNTLVVALREESARALRDELSKIIRGRKRRQLPRPPRPV